jgi:hypothetical protein
MEVFDKILTLVPRLVDSVHKALDITDNTLDTGVSYSASMKDEAEFDRDESRFKREQRVVERDKLRKPKPIPRPKPKPKPKPVVVESTE